MLNNIFKCPGVFKCEFSTDIFYSLLVVILSPGCSKKTRGWCTFKMLATLLLLSALSTLREQCTTDTQPQSYISRATTHDSCATCLRNVKTKTTEMLSALLKPQGESLQARLLLCTMTRSEASTVAEWVVFHLQQGFEQVYGL